MTEPTAPAPDAPAAELAEGILTPAEAADMVADKTDWKAEARKWEQRAKENKAAAAEIEKARKAAMSETERAIAEAEERGRMAVRSEYGARLAQTEFRAAAAARNPGYDVGKALGYVDLAKFVGDDGEPDNKAIAAAVADLVPEASGPQPPSFDGGTRQPAASGPSMTQLIRAAAGRA